MYGINLIIEGVKYLTSTNERYIESQQKIIDSANDKITKYDEEISSLEGLQKKLKEAGTNSEKLAEIQDELNKAIGVSNTFFNSNVKYVDVANQKIYDRIKALKKLREEELKDKVAAQKNIYNNNEVDNNWGEDDTLGNYIEYVKNKRQKATVGGMTLYFPATGQSEVDLANQYFNTSLSQEGISYAEYISDYLKNFDFKLGIPNSEEIQNYLNDQYKLAKDVYGDYLSNLETILGSEQLNKILEQAVYMHPDNLDSVYKEIENFIGDIDESNIQELYDNYIVALSDGIEGNSEKAYKKLEKSIKELSEKYPFARFALSGFLGTVGSDPDEYNNVSQSETPISDIFALKDASGTATPLSNLKDSLDGVISSYKNLKSAVDEFRNTGSLSLETIESLIAQGDNWLDYIDLGNGQLHLNEDALYSVAEAKMHQLKIQALENLAANVKGIKDAASAQEYLESTLYNTSDAYDKQAESIYEATLATLNLNLANATDEKDKQAIQETINRFKDDFAKLNDTLNNVNFLESVAGNSGGLSNVISDLQSLADLINGTEKEIDNSGKISFEQIQKITSQYPVLEELLMNYINGKASEADVINALKEVYQTDVQNYSIYYANKMSKDNNFYQNMVNNLPDTLKNLADFYNLDLGNYNNYVQAKSNLTKKQLELQQKIAKLESTKLSNDVSDSQNALEQFYKNPLNTTKYNNEYGLGFNKFIDDYNKNISIKQKKTQSEINTIDQILAEFDNLSNPTFNTTLDLHDYNTLTSSDTSSSNSSSDSLSDSPSESTRDPETFDWIERAVNNINDALDRMKAKAADAYSSWISRNENLRHAIATTQNAIDLQSQAYARYMAQADSVPLSEAWKNVVQSGAIDISAIEDEDLAGNIKEYQNWYDKAQDCLKTQDDLKSSLNELNSQKFNNLQSEYEAVIELMETQKSLLEGQITVLSGTGTYDALRSQQTQILQNLQSERAALQDTLNNLNIEAGTEKWNEMNSSIAGIDQSIQNAWKKLQEINKMQFDNLKEFYQLSINLMNKQKDLAENRITLLSSSSDYEKIKKQQTDIINMSTQQFNKLTELRNSPVFAGMSYEDQMNVQSELADSEQNVDNAYKALKQISQLQFDNVKEAFDFNNSRLEHTAKMMDSKISLAEAKGLFADSSYYSTKKETVIQQKNSIDREIKQLTMIRDSSGYEIGTSEWNAMTSEIMSLKEQGASLVNELENIDITLRSIEWETFDYLADSINDITGESDFLIELMGKGKLVDNNGKFTSEGTASLALNLVNSDTYKQEAALYFNKAQEMKNELKRGAGKDVLEKYNEYLQKGQEALLSQKESTKNAISLVEERYNAELNALQKVIDKKKEQMQQEKDLYDYQKSIKEKTDNIASLEKQQTAFSGDNSEETMARIQKLQLELKDAKQDLADAEYEKYLSDSQNMLDTLAEDYENWMNERLDNEEALLNELVLSVNSSGDSILQTLNTIAEENGFYISDFLETVFDSFNVLSDRFGEDTQRQFNETPEETLAKALRLAPSDEKVDLEDAQDNLKHSLGIDVDSGTEKAIQSKLKQYFNIAGLLRDGLTLDQAAEIGKKARGELANPENYTTDDILKASQIALKISNGYSLDHLQSLFESVQTTSKMMTTQALAIPDPSGKAFTAGSRSLNMGDICIELPNVTNYSEFRNELINDSTFEKSICTIVNNAMLGKSTIEKQKYINN